MWILGDVDMFTVLACTLERRVCIIALRAAIRCVLDRRRFGCCEYFMNLLWDYASGNTSRSGAVVTRAVRGRNADY